MTDTEIAAAVADLTEAIRAKGYEGVRSHIGCTTEYARDPEPRWEIGAQWAGMEASPFLKTSSRKFTTIGDAMEAAQHEIAKLPNITPEHQAAEAFRAAPATSIYPQGRPTNEQR
jgi:hypothetical protein